MKYQGRLCVPNVDDSRNQILEEAHGSRYSIHLEFKDMYHEIREVFWWEVLKRDSGICCEMSKWPTSESQEPIVECLTSRNTISHLEVGRNQYGFCGRFASDKKVI